MTGAVLCALGLVFFGAGMVSGGREYVRNADLNSFDGAASANDPDDRAILNREKIESFQILDVNLKTIDLRVEESEDDDFYLSYDLDKDQGKEPVSWKTEEGTLQITEKDSAFSDDPYIIVDISFFQALMNGTIADFEAGRNQITLYVPADTELKQVSCKVQNSDLAIDGLKCKNICLQAVNGDLDLRNMKVSEGMIANKNGAIDLIESSLNQVELESKMEDVMLQNTFCQDCSFDLQAGDLDAERSYFTGNCQFHSDLGGLSFYLEKDHLKDLEIKAKSNTGDVELDETCEKCLYAVSARDHLEIFSDHGDILVTVF